MSIKEENAKKVQVKLALARKHENLAKVAGSTTKQKTYQYHAAKFRREAADLGRL